MQIRTLLLIVLFVLPLAAQGKLDVGSPVAPNGTTATFVGVQPADVADTVTFGTLGGVWASMPGPYDTPILCRCATLAKPVMLRLKFRGVGGVHVTVAEEESHILLSTVDADFPDQGGDMILAWVVNGAVRFYFGPASNLRNLFLDPVVPLTSITKPPPWIPVARTAPPTNLRVTEDRK